MYEDRCQNPYFDWIGAQMKGELFGMLAPAWRWHADKVFNPKEDLKKLALCLELSLQDALVAHRGIGVVGELFVSAMVAIAIDHDPATYRGVLKFPKSTANTRPNAIEPEPTEEEIEQHGIMAEGIITDIKRLKEVLLIFDKINQQDVLKFFEFIDPVIETFESNHDNRDWESVWSKCEKIAENYRQYLIQDAKKRLGTNKTALKVRLKELEDKKSFGVHTVLNNSGIALGLIYGDGDMFQTIQRATETGLDVDCNAGNAAAILGAYIGQHHIPVYYKRFIRDEILSPLKNFKEVSLKKLAERTYKQAQRCSKL
jgi:hypothetical protein